MHQTGMVLFGASNCLLNYQ